jgi:hypothetical protein
MKETEKGVFKLTKERKSWTKEQIQALIDNHQHMSDKKLEPITGHPKDSNATKRRELGLIKYVDAGVMGRIFERQIKGGFMEAK